MSRGKQVLGVVVLLVVGASTTYGIREYRAESKLTEANRLREAGELDAAIALYDESDSIRPRDERTLNNRGLAYFQKGDIERAICDFSEAIRVAPYVPFAYENRAAAYEKIGQHEKAQSDAQNSRRVREKFQGG